jgi:hypothetical protein
MIRKPDVDKLQQENKKLSRKVRDLEAQVTKLKRDLMQATENPFMDRLVTAFSGAVQDAKRRSDQIREVGKENCPRCACCGYMPPETPMFEDGRVMWCPICAYSLGVIDWEQYKEASGWEKP